MDQAMKTEDEIMAGYLLKGGKMLSKTCGSCGCPLFEYKGETFCAVCRERQIATGPEESQKLPAAGGDAGRDEGPRKGQSICGDDRLLIDSLDEALVALAGRAKEEPDPDRILLLMNAIKRGIEARNLLR